MKSYILPMFATLLFSFVSSHLFCQNVFIEGRLTNYHQSSVPFFKKDLKRSKDLMIPPLTYTSNSFSFSFLNPRPQLFSLLLNPVFIEPKDTIQFDFSFVDRPDGSFYDSVWAKGAYPGNYMYYNHFKRWDDERPDLKGTDSASVVNYYNTLKSFYFTMIRSRQNSFAKQYPISKNFNHFLAVELPFTFLNTLLTTYEYAPVKIPATLRSLIQSDIDNSALNDTTLLDSESYLGFLNRYGAYFLINSEHSGIYSFSHFKQNIENINRHFVGLNKDFAISNTIIMYSLTRTSYHDSEVDNYISNLTGKIADSVLHKNLIQFINMRSSVNKTAFNEIQLKSVNGDTILLKDALSKKHQVTLVDFWASWCGPCREQDVFLADFHKQKNDMYYVAISIDEDPVAWLKSVKENQNDFVHQYILLNSTESEKLTGIIGLHAIPRYVLTDKQNQLAYLHASMPKNKQQLLSEVMLVEELSKSKQLNGNPPPPPNIPVGGKAKN